MSINFKRFKNSLFLSAAFIAFSCSTGQAAPSQLLQDQPFIRIWNIEDYYRDFGQSSAKEAYNALSELGSEVPIWQQEGSKYYYWSLLTADMRMNLATLSEKNNYLTFLAVGQENRPLSNFVTRIQGTVLVGGSTIYFPSFSESLLYTPEAFNVTGNVYIDKLYAIKTSDENHLSHDFLSSYSALLGLSTPEFAVVIGNDISYNASLAMNFLMMEVNSRASRYQLSMNNAGTMALLGGVGSFDLLSSAFLGNVTIPYDYQVGDPFAGGGAIYNERDSFNSISNIFISNAAEARTGEEIAYNRGGAVFNAGNWISGTEGNTARQDKFFFNRAYAGGAVYQAFSGSLTMYNPIFVQNTATLGGAVYLGLKDEYKTFLENGDSRLDSTDFADHNESLLDRAVFAKNKATVSGGAVYNFYEGKIAQTGGHYGRRIMRSVFEENSAQESGGAIYSDGFLEISESTFSRNIAVDDMSNPLSGKGGAIYHTYSDLLGEGAGSDNVLSVLGGTFEGNTAYSGGAIYVASSGLTIDASNFIDNIAYEYGGAIMLKGASAQISNSVFSGNVMNAIGTEKANDIYMIGNSSVSLAETKLSGGLASDGTTTQTITIASGTVQIGGNGISTYRGTVSANADSVLKMQANTGWFTNASAINFADATTLDVMQGTVSGDIQAYRIDSMVDELSVKVDLDASDGSSDSFDIDTVGTGHVIVKNVSLANPDALVNAEDQIDFTLLTNNGTLILDSAVTAMSFDLGHTAYKTENDSLVASVNHDQVFYTHNFEGSALGRLEVTAADTVSLIQDNELVNDWEEVGSVIMGDTLALLNQTDQFSEKTFTFSAAATYTGSATPGVTSGSMSINGVQDTRTILDFGNVAGAQFRVTGSAGLNLSKVTIVKDTEDATPVIHNENTTTLSNVSIYGNPHAADIENSGTVDLYGAVTLGGGISGTGSTTINTGASVNVGTLSQRILTIASNGSLSVAADELSVTNSFANDGTLFLGGGTSNVLISGTGTTEIGKSDVTAYVVSSAKINTSISILNASSKLDISATNVGGAVSNKGTLTLSAGTLGQAVSGSGKTIINGAVVSNAAISNKITINSGKSLQIAANNIGNTVTNAGTLTLTGGELSKVINGAGSVVINGNVMAASAINNPITVNASKSLQISAGNIRNTVSNAGTLMLLGGTLSREISGAGNVQIAGTTNISGSFNSLTGTTSLISGSLTLTGDTTFNKTLNVNAGALNLGVQQLNVNQVNFAAGSQLNVTLSKENGVLKVGKISANDSITVASDAVLNFILSDFSIQKGHSETFTVLAADGSLTDNFTMAENGRYTFSKVSDGVYRVRGDLSAGEIVTQQGGNANNSAVADAWDLMDTSDPTSGEIARTLAGLSTDGSRAQEYQEALTALAPEEKPMVSSVSNDNVRSVFNAVSTRLSNLRSMSYSNTTNQQMRRSISNMTDIKGRSGGARYRNSGSYFGSFWGQGLYNYAKLNKKQGFESNLAGGAVGADIGFGNVKLGIGASYTAGSVDGFRRETDIKNYSAFVYGEYHNPSGFFINAAGSYGLSEYKEKKTVLNTKVKGNYDVNTVGAQASIGWDFNGFIPEAGIRYSKFEQEKYTDSAGQTVDKTSGKTMTGVVGATISPKYRIKGNTYFEPSVRLAAAYDFKTDKIKNIVTLGNGTTYEVTSESLDKKSLEAGAGLAVRFEYGEVSLNYEGRFRKKYQDHTGMLNLKYNF